MTDQHKKNETWRPLDRLYANAPNKPYCSDDKTASLIRPRAVAFARAYVQINPPEQCYWLVFDIDGEDYWLWDDHQFPAPNLVVANPKKPRHAHLFYAIEPVCTGINGRRKPREYLDAVRRAMCQRLKADPGFTSPVCKNPLSARWQTSELHGHIYSLGELADYLDLTPRDRRPVERNPLGRNCTLFDHLRQWAYREVNEAKGGNYDAWYEQVLRQADTLNLRDNPSYPMTWPEVKATAKSVARWTWSKYDGCQIRRGVMAFGGELPLENRQRLAARRTHQVRKQNTIAKIERAVAILRKQGAAITHAAISAVAQVHRKTVSVYKHLIVESETSINTTSRSLKQLLKRRELRDATPDTFAVYQMTAGFEGSQSGGVLTRSEAQQKAFSRIAQIRKRLLEDTS